MIREKSRSLLGKKYRSLIDPRSFRARCDVFAYSTLLIKALRLRVLVSVSLKTKSGEGLNSSALITLNWKRLELYQ